MIAKSNHAHQLLGDTIFANYLIINSLNNHIKFIFNPKLAEKLLSQKESDKPIKFSKRVVRFRLCNPFYIWEQKRSYRCR
jgi:hypothetical protein